MGGQGHKEGKYNEAIEKIYVADINDPEEIELKELKYYTVSHKMVFPAKFSRINGNQFIGRAKVKKNRYQPLLITVN